MDRSPRPTTPPRPTRSCWPAGRSCSSWPGPTREEAETLRLPAVPEPGAHLLADLQAGSAEATTELEAERAEIEDRAPITVERQGGALGGASSPSRGPSWAGPRVADYDQRTCREAFADNDGCDHVVQPG